MWSRCDRYILIHGMNLVKDFYPSIKETLLIKAINFAEKRVNITNEDRVIIKQTRKSLLYDNREPWM